MSAATKEGGMVMTSGPLDICKVPAPPSSPIPMPFPNIGALASATKECQKIFVDGMPALNKKSVIPMTDGDQAGVAGGIQSGKIMGEAKFTMGSQKVIFEGDAAVFMGNTCTQNEGNGVGALSVPSQNLVMVQS